jgi:hypothetical protein
MGDYIEFIAAYLTYNYLCPLSLSIDTRLFIFNNENKLSKF